MDATNRNVVLYDSAGNELDTHVSIDGGMHLGVSVEQFVYADANNSSTTNLDAGNSYTFEGTGTSTLGVVGLQWSLKTDQNATVYVEESDTGVSNWDISNSFDYIASHGGRGETVQATKAYWRIRVVLDNGTATTYFRLAGVLCPIATPLPSALSPDGRLLSESTITGQQNPERHVWVSPTNSLTVNSNVRLIGHTFDGTIKDPNFWTEAVTGSGVVAQSGEIKLSTSTTANSTASYTTVSKARFVVGAALQFTGAFKFNTAGTADNIRQLGAYDANDGFFFQLDGTTFSVVSRKATSDTLVSSGSFNGHWGAIFEPDNSTYYKFDIEWTPVGAFYYVNSVLLHKSVGGHLTQRLSLPITFENNNDNGQDANVVMDCLGVAISRQGSLETSATSKYILTGTDVLKYGAGVLRRIIVSDNVGGVIIYDNTAGSGTIITDLDTAQGSNPLGAVEYGVSFSIGLTIVITGNVGVTVVYE